MIRYFALIPEAVFCANDHTAFAVMDTARAEFGLAVGQDVSIVGFDDVPLAAWPAFNLTTYSQPIHALVDRVIAVTLRHLSEDAYDAIHEVIAGELVIRGSARIPKAWNKKAWGTRITTYEVDYSAGACHTATAG